MAAERGSVEALNSAQTQGTLWMFEPRLAEKDREMQSVMDVCVHFVSLYQYWLGRRRRRRTFCDNGDSLLCMRPFSHCGFAVIRVGRS